MLLFTRVVDLFIITSNRKWEKFFGFLGQDAPPLDAFSATRYDQKRTKLLQQDKGLITYDDEEITWP